MASEGLDGVKRAQNKNCKINLPLQNNKRIRISRQVSSLIHINSQNTRKNKTYVFSRDCLDVSPRSLHFWAANCRGIWPSNTKWQFSADMVLCQFHTPAAVFTGNDFDFSFAQLWYTCVLCLGGLCAVELRSVSVTLSTPAF